jgi:hypothetical protein
MTGFAGIGSSCPPSIFYFPGFVDVVHKQIALRYSDDGQHHPANL